MVVDDDMMIRSIVSKTFHTRSRVLSLMIVEGSSTPIWITFQTLFFWISIFPGAQVSSC